MGKLRLMVTKPYDQNTNFFLNLTLLLSPLSPPSLPLFSLYFKTIDFFSFTTHRSAQRFQFTGQLCSPPSYTIQISCVFFSFKVLILSKISNKERWFDT